MKKKQDIKERFTFLFCSDDSFEKLKFECAKAKIKEPILRCFSWMVKKKNYIEEK